MSLPPDDPRITAIALGELEADDTLDAGDRAEVEAHQELADLLTEALADEPALELDDARRDALFEAIDAPRARVVPLRTRRWLPVAAAAAALLVIVSITALVFMLNQGEDDAQAKQALDHKAATAVGPIGEVETSAEALSAVCQAKLDGAELESAHRACTQALEADPEHAPARALLAQVEEEQRQLTAYGEARELLDDGACLLALDTLRTLNPQSLAALRMKEAGVLDDARACVEDDLVAQITAAANAYEIERAEDTLAQLSQSAPESPELGSLKSLIEAKREEYQENKKKRPKKSNGGSDKGSKEPEMSADEKKARFQASMDTGLKALRSKDYAAAIVAYKEALALRSQDIQALTSLALAYEKNGQACQALKVYTKALPKLVGRRQASTQKKIDTLNAECL